MTKGGKRHDRPTLSQWIHFPREVLHALRLSLCVHFGNRQYRAWAGHTSTRCVSVPLPAKESVNTYVELYGAAAGSRAMASTRTQSIPRSPSVWFTCLTAASQAPCLGPMPVNTSLMPNSADPGHPPRGVLTRILSTCTRLSSGLRERISLPFPPIRSGNAMKSNLFLPSPGAGIAPGVGEPMNRA
jgi:hypothetical protein